jgi:hypothetical protein
VRGYDASHKRSTPLRPPLAKVFPSGENASVHIHPSSRQRVRSSRPVPLSHIEVQRQQLKLPFESLSERKEKLRQASESRGGRAEEGE